MNKKLFDEGQRLEKADRLKDAASVYQRVVDADPGDQEAVGRLLVVYRRLKEHQKELRVVEAALGAVEERDIAAREKWLKAHPGAARLGKEVLKKLGGESMTAFGTDPLVEKLLRRKAVLEKKTGKVRKKKVSPRLLAAEKKKKEAEERREAKEREREEKAAQKAARQAAKLAETQARRQAREAKGQPSLFVVSLRYLAPLEKIDASMEKHVAFLDKHFAAGEFLVSGRQVPRKGGIIIARGKDRAAVERIMKQDPFVKGKLASVDIVEFVGSKMGRGLEGWIRGKKINLRHP